jgi:hypothetical protein
VAREQRRWTEAFSGSVGSGDGPPRQLPPQLSALVVQQELRTSGRWARRRLFCVDPARPEAGSCVVTVAPAGDGILDSWAAWRESTGMGVVPLLDAALVDSWSHEVTPYYPAGSLADLLRAHGPLPPQRLLPVVRQVAGVLDRMHRPSASTGWRVFVHRHLTPANVLVAAQGTPRILLTGLGTGRVQRQHTEFPGADGATGYSPPEALESGACSPASDWWALGVMLAELLCGECLVPARRGQQTPDEMPSWLIARLPDMPEGLATPWRSLLTGLLAPDPRQRWAYPQVQAWSAGGQVSPVRSCYDSGHASRARSGASREADRSRDGSERVRPRIEFRGVWYDGPVVLAEAMAGAWDAACAYLLGQGWEELRVWSRVISPGLGRRLDQVHVDSFLRGRHLDLVLCEVLSSLDPDRRATFRGVLTDPGGLAGLARAAVGGDTPAGELVARLFASGSLEILARAPGGEALDEANRRWEPLVRNAIDVANRHRLALEAGLEQLPALLLGALVDDDAAQTLSAAAQSVVRERAEDQPWVRALQTYAGPDGLALQALAVLVGSSCPRQAASGNAELPAAQGLPVLFRRRFRRWFRSRKSSLAHRALTPREPLRPGARLSPGAALRPGPSVTAGGAPQPGSPVLTPRTVPLPSCAPLPNPVPQPMAGLGFGGVGALGDGHAPWMNTDTANREPGR